MTYDELMRAIEESTPEDWVHEDGHWTYKKDLRVRFEDRSFTEPERSAPTFHEPWVEGLGHNAPVRRIFRIQTSPLSARLIAGVTLAEKSGIECARGRYL